jgi:hypothetical protein
MFQIFRFPLVILSELFGTLHANMTNGINRKAPFYELTIRGKCIMTANLFFSQAIFQTNSPDIERGMMGGSVQNRSTVSKTYDDSSGNDGESFLNTLKHIAKDLNSTQQSRRAGEVKSSETHRFDSGDKWDATACPADALETGVSETTTQSVSDLDNAEVQKPHALNFSEIINALEKLGIVDSAGGSSSPNKADEILSHEEGMVALKMLIARLGQNDFVPSAEIKTELDRIQQIIADTQTGNAFSHNDEDPLGELADSRSTEPADLNQFIKRIVSGQEDQRGSSGVHMGESDSEQKQLDPFVKINRVATKLPNEIRQTGSFQPAENSQTAFPSENLERLTR